MTGEVRGLGGKYVPWQGAQQPGEHVTLIFLFPQTIICYFLGEHSII